MFDLPTEDEPVRIIQGDCLEVLRSMPAGCVHAVITDPPYNVGFKYSGDATGDRRDDYPEWCGQWFAELERVCVGPILISCGIVNLAMWHKIKPPRWVLCWWKPASSKRSPVGFNNWEPVMMYGPKSTRRGCDVIRTTEQAKLAAWSKTKSLGHPCPKPVEWATKQITLLTEPGDIILDPFAGSGTTGKAAVIEGRRCVLIEKEPAYAAIARRRVADAMGSGLLAPANL